MKNRLNILVFLAAGIILSGIAGCHAMQQQEGSLKTEAGSQTEINTRQEEDPLTEEESGIEESEEAPRIRVINELAGEEGTETEEQVKMPDEAESREDTDRLDERKAEEDFYMSEITDEIFSRIQGLSFKDECTIQREDLRYLHVLHKDINGNVHEGEMIVNMHIAEDMLEILKELYEQDYPIEKIRLVDEYGADDEASMEDNNSSCFNFRFVPRTTKVSKHGMGLAVDINTLYNPYITTVDGRINVDPSNAEPYADRDREFDYKIEKGDLCYNLFTEHGFEWGGEWKNSKDYQHFEIPSSKIDEWY